MNNKLKTITNLFEKKEIRSIWNKEEEEYYFSVVDVIGALTDSNEPRRYWPDLKRKLISEGSQLYEKIVQLKMMSKNDGKMYLTDVLDTKEIFRLIESIPSHKAEPFKLWLANLGSERIDEVFDPEIAVNRAIEYYQNKGYDDEWIKTRLNGILNRKKLTDVWKAGDIKESYEYALLTNEIYKEWSGMTAKEYKGLRKESLSDNMTDIEVVLTDLGEITTRNIARKEHPQGLKENIEVARRGDNVSAIAKISYEKATNDIAITKESVIGERYINDKKDTIK